MQIPLWKIILLAVIQGITEFLPISSSGHLVIVANLFPEELPDLADLNIVLHLGTLFSILVFYWQRVMRLMTQDRRTLGLLIVGTIPAVLFGLPLKLFMEDVLESPLVVGFLLPVTGLILIFASRLPQGKGEYSTMGFGRAVGIGVAQACAVLPGLSRSGLTIAAGIGSGLSRSEAATFSFLLAILAIGGAGTVEVLMLAREGVGSTPISSLVVGALVAFVVGWMSLWWLVRWVEQGRLQLFALWCIPVGIAVVIWQLVFAS